MPIPGPLYRLPCSSTMSSYVPAISSVVGVNGVNGGGLQVSGTPATTPAGLYSLETDPHTCRTAANCRNNVQQQQQQERQLATSAITPRQQDPAFHQLYWNRPVPRLANNQTRINQSGTGVKFNEFNRM